MNAACHTEDVDHACESIDNIPPSAVDEHAFIRCPPCAAEVSCDGESSESRLHIRNVCDHDVCCNDEPREPLEPLLFSDAPFVLDHHEAYASDVSSIELEIVEPSVHESNSRVLGSAEHAYMCEDEIDCKDSRDDYEYSHAADLCSAADLVHCDESAEDEHPADDLHCRMIAVKLK